MIFQDNDQCVHGWKKNRENVFCTLIQQHYLTIFSHVLTDFMADHTVNIKQRQRTSIPGEPSRYYIITLEGNIDFHKGFQILREM